jgi:hypothetical protein
MKNEKPIVAKAIPTAYTCNTLAQASKIAFNLMLNEELNAFAVSIRRYQNGKEFRVSLTI